MKELTAVEVAKITTSGRYRCGKGLWLQVTPSTSAKAKGKAGKPAVTKSWLFRYMIDRTARQMGLGDFPTFSLAEARDRALRAKQLATDGIDPIEARTAQRRAAKAEAAKAITFRDAAERYIAAHTSSWRNPKHAVQWPATLATYAYPVIGDLPVAAVEVAHVLKIIEPIWPTKTETASRVRGRIETVLDWATARGYRIGDNPARWRGHMDKLLPARSQVSKVRHQPAMLYVDLPGFMGELRRLDGISARALEWTVLTAARTGEAIGARWAEIDHKANVWTVPAERSKSRREHRVPLSDRAVALLAAMPRRDGGDYVFPGAREGKPLSNMAMLEMLRGMRPGVTVHGFRSSFRDWAGEQTNYPREVAEAALSHVLSDKTEAAYRRGDALEKRRRLMEAWAGYCGSTPKGEGKVISMRSAG